MRNESILEWRGCEVIEVNRSSCVKMGLLGETFSFFFPGVNEGVSGAADENERVRTNYYLS